MSRFLAREAAAEIIWVSDGISVDAPGEVTRALADAMKGREVTILDSGVLRPLALAGVANSAQGLSVRVLRAAPNGRDGGTVRALDRRGLPLAETPFAFEAGATSADALVRLPVDLRNEIARLDIAEERTAGAVALVDEASRRRRIGLVSGATADTAQPLLSPTYYVSKALTPFADVRELRMGPAEAIRALLDEKAPMLILADTGALPQDVRQRLAQFVEGGGVLLRFAGSRLAAAGSDDLSPVKLRRGGRALGGALSWESPRTLAPFDRASPFYGLTPPAEVSVTRQLLAEPDAELTRKTWAALADGTPIITAERRGQGLTVLVHVTADTTWSNLPLSGLFVDMLRRIVALAGTGEAQAQAQTAGGAPVFVSPLRTLDGFGVFNSPPATARPIAIGGTRVASLDHPPGFYGQNDAPLAVNTLAADATLAPLDHGAFGARVERLARGESVDWRPWLVALALLGFAIDTLAVLWLSGRLGLIRRRAAAATALALAGGFALALALPAPPALAQQGAPPAAPAAPAPRPPVSPKEMEAALTTRFAYVLTGDVSVDEVSGRD